MIVVGIGSSLESLPNVFLSQIKLFTVMVPGVVLLDKAHGQIKSLIGEAQKRDLVVEGRTFLTKRIKP